MRAIFLLAPLLLLASRLAAAETVSPEEFQRFKDAASYSQSQHGTGVLVMRNGEILFEDYAPGWSAEKPHLLASGTKSFSGVMAVCAVQDGLLSLEEKVAATLTEWKDDPRKSQITIRQLLSLSSGIEGGENGSSPSYLKAVSVAQAVAAPGERFSYGPIPFQCFGELMRRKLQPRQETVEQYMHRKMLDPLGIQVGFWRQDDAGNINIPAGAFLTPREWVKFGEMVRLGGRVAGHEIVPAALLAECFQPASANPGYGMCWWRLGATTEGSAVAEGGGGLLRAQHAEEMAKKLNFRPPPDTVAALGKGKNCCYIIPSLKMVIVRMGDSTAAEFNDTEFLFKVLGKGAPQEGYE